MNKEQLLVLNQVNAGMIREEIYEGEPHYMIASATMPDDIVMNGLLYPAEEIEKSYMGLNGVLAPLGHPVSDDGEFISAASAFGIRHYGVGAQVVNVRRENGRVLHDTAINIAVAKETDRGKRLLDRIEALMNGEGKPIHTSTGIYLKRTMLDSPMTNQYGEYNGIASDYQFDHNAILLDEVGAATPDSGVGMFVNVQGHDVSAFVLNMEAEQEIDTNEEHKSLFAKFMEFMKFATNNHKTYNDNVTNQSEELDMTPEELKAALAEQATALQANFNESLASAVKPLQEKVDALEANAQAEETAKKAELAEKLGLEADEAKGMSVNALQKLADKLDAQEQGEFGERVGQLDTNSSKSGYSLLDTEAV